jgi:penicillin-binding protein 1C
VLKPFVYGLALDEGLIHPASLLQDVPRRTGDYRPGNFDSGFHGPISMSEALVRSLNLPAVQVLEAYGPKRFAAKLRNVGLPLYLPNGAAPNLSLVQNWKIWRQRIPRLLATARQANCAYSLTIRCLNGL